MSAELQPYDSSLPDPASLSYADLVAAWHEVESRSAWFKARLAAAVEARGDDLRRYAADVGVAYQTLKNYRSVAKAYAGSTDVGTFPFGVADALRDQPDRLELASREEPWTVAEARELVASRRKPLPPAPGPSDEKRPGPVLPEPGSSGPAQSGVPEPASKPPVPDPAPQPCAHDYRYMCRHCGQRDKAFSADIEKLMNERRDLGHQLEAARAHIAELEVQLQEALSAADGQDSAEDAQEPGSPVDSGPCASCEVSGALLAWVRSPDGSRHSAYVCDPCLAAAAVKHPDCLYSRAEPEGPPVTSEQELDDLIPVMP